MKNFKYYAIISGLFTASLLMSNIFDTKIFMLGSLALPTGIIIFPIAYVFGDILTEVYGYSASRKVIWTGFISLLIFILFIYIAVALKPAPFWSHQDAFETVLMKLPRIIAASITAYFLGEFSNSFVLAKMKVKTSGKWIGLRFVTSTIVGQAVDTSVFVLIAFIGTMQISELALVTFSGWLVKVIWEIVALPLSIPFSKWLKKKENEDYYDRETNFNPFKLES